MIPESMMCDACGHKHAGPGICWVPYGPHPTNVCVCEA